MGVIIAMAFTAGTVTATTVATTADPGIASWLGFTPSQWTLSGIVFAVVMMVLTGFLKPWNQVRDILRDVRQDRDDWKAIAQQSQQNFSTLANATKESTESSKTVAKFVTAAQDELGVDKQ